MTAEDVRKWFETFKATQKFAGLKERPVAYFCAEYALETRVHTYAGGLGVLAGDVVREAADLGLPFVAVGIYYRRGYSCAKHGALGVTCDCDAIDPQSVGLQPVLDASGVPVTVSVPLGKGEIRVRAWKWERHGLPVYLLDADVEGNSDGDRGITARLYVGDRETRLKQEIILGIGGLRLLEVLGLHPSVYHLNEGHSAFLAYELVRHEMAERQLGFDEARQFARRRIVLTNHTLVTAGNETFSNDIVSLLLDRYARELQVPASELVKIGLVQDSSQFSMSMLAMRMASVINAVSVLHAKKAKELWADHPMVAVTNGIHIPTWDALTPEAEGADKGELWRQHQAKKRELLAHIKATTGHDWGEDDLLLGWARRITGYKRPLAPLFEAEKFASIARKEGRRVRLVYAGTSHPSDTEGAALRRELRDISEGPLGDVMTVLPEYTLDVARMLTAGCDAWLNTPVVGFEACGTSGMKAALNGVLPVSTKDGWMGEVDTFGLGWTLDGVHVTQSFVGILENEIAPMYYQRDAAGIPQEWVRHMAASRALIRNRYSATRMLKDYVQTLYT